MTTRHTKSLLDLLGRRWALRVLWELRGGHELTFRALRTACDEVSTSVLNDRLHELREAGIVTAEDGYRLTPRGRRLVAPLRAWVD